MKQITSGKSLDSTGRPAWYSVMTQRGGAGAERDAQEGMIDLHCCALLHGRNQHKNIKNYIVEAYFLNGKDLHDISLK